LIEEAGSAEKDLELDSVNRATSSAAESGGEESQWEWEWDREEERGRGLEARMVQWARGKSISELLLTAPSAFSDPLSASELLPDTSELRHTPPTPSLIRANYMLFTFSFHFLQYILFILALALGK
jgi:hypothetical protein